MRESWLSQTLPIAGLYACRMLGLFLLIPVLSVFSSHLTGSTPQWVGLTLGAYGLAQACMQLPFGMLSDVFGRKPMLYIGLGLLLVGSLVGCYTTSIYGMLFARLLQGTGAIGSVLLAILADTISPHHRAKSMALIGMSIGGSFTLAMLIGPLMAAAWGLSSIFVLTFCLAGLGLCLVWYQIPVTTAVEGRVIFQWRMLRSVLKQRTLQWLNMSIFLQHAVLTSTFFVLPIQLKSWIAAGYLAASWQFYLPVVVGAFVCMMPVLVWMERKQFLMQGLTVAVLGILVAQTLLGTYSGSWWMWVSLVFLYLVAFNFCETLLPSQVSKVAAAQHRGTAMGIYSTAQFLGIFFGGSLAGLLYAKSGIAGVYGLNAGLSVCWLLGCWQPRLRAD